MKWQTCKELCTKLWAALVAFFFPPRKAIWQPTRALAGYDALLIQPQVARALGSADAALIVQKIHDWMEYNKLHEKPGHYHKGRWWMFNTFEEWQRFHFPWLSIPKLKRLFYDLEDRGIVLHEALNPAKRTKWYSVNYDRLAALVAAQIPAREGQERRATMNDERAESDCQRPKSSSQRSLADDSLTKSPTQKKNYTKQDTQNNNMRAREDEPQAVVVSEPSPPLEKSLTAEFPEQRDLSENADRDDPTTPTPSSAAPLPLPPEPAQVREVCDVGGISTGMAAGLMERYGVERVLAVARYTLAQPNLTNPAGFLIDELKHHRLDLEQVTEVPRLTGRTSDFVVR